MDRWGDGDGLERGPKQAVSGVAKFGMGGFVKADKGMGSDSTDGDRPQIEVVASRREQKRQQMPPPPARTESPAPAGAAPGKGFKPPAWAGVPPSAAVLEVVKGGQIIEHLLLQRPATVFGRSPTADVLLDHPSISRQHAAVLCQRTTGSWVLQDLDSAHGTFVGGRQVSKGVPVELAEGARVRFAASSRDYILRLSDAPAQQPLAAAQREQPEQLGQAKRKRAETPPDEGPRDATEEPAGSKRCEGDINTAGAQDDGELESRDSSVGPAPAPEGAAGRFQNLVQSRVLRGGGGAGAPDQASAAERQRRLLPDPERGRPRPAAQPFKKSGMYDLIPPVSGTSSGALAS